MGRGGPCNHVSAAEGRSKFLRVIGDCIRGACEQAGASEPNFASAVLGFSGGPEDKEALVGELIRADRVLVSHDALVALVGACAGAPGVITIAGTGSIAFGRNANGVTARAGGWGYVFGDEGGGFDIVRQALRAILRSEEGWGPETALHNLLLEETGARDANDLLHRFYSAEYPRSRVATLAKIVDQAAIENDEVARAILEKAARELATLASSVRRQIFHPREPARMSYVGGVFRSAVLCAAFKALIEAESGNLFQPPVFGPAAGGLIEAYRRAGISPALSNVPPEK
jgi:N-acetylglucosamine kinase-like BadF-type ATPase